MFQIVLISARSAFVAILPWAKVLAVGFIVLFSITGCAPNTAALSVGLDAVGEAQVSAHKLGNDLRIQQLQGDSIGGIYRAKVVVENTKKKQQTLQYQFSWYDKSNIEVGFERDAWTPVVIYGKDQKTVVAVAPSSDATGFRVSFRDLKANKTFKTNFFGKR